MEDELIKIWQSSPKAEQIKFEKSRLILDMQSSLDRFHRFIKYRIIHDQIACIIVIAGFIYGIYLVPPILSKIACFFIVLWAIWYLLQLVGSKKMKPTSVTLNYLEYLEKNRDYLTYLKETIIRSMYSYAILALPAYFLFISGVYFDGLSDITFFIKLIFLGIFVHIGAYAYSKWEVKKVDTYGLKKIDELIEVMEE
ncbi:hypothetical protein [Aurantibacter sp.]|uniref:hypothetical protein n=1 Tax=Aurantibacter sp. TaxID=2807103 RepID=UPI003265D576